MILFEFCAIKYKKGKEKKINFYNEKLLYMLKNFIFTKQ